MNPHCADVKEVLKDERVYRIAAAEAFPLYNKSHMICLEFPDRSGEVMQALSFSLCLLSFVKVSIM